MTVVCAELVCTGRCLKGPLLLLRPASIHWFTPIYFSYILRSCVIVMSAQKFKLQGASRLKATTPLHSFITPADGDGTFDVDTVQLVDVLRQTAPRAGVHRIAVVEFLTKQTGLVALPCARFAIQSILHSLQARQHVRCGSSLHGRQHPRFCFVLHYSLLRHTTTCIG